MAFVKDTKNLEDLDFYNKNLDMNLKETLFLEMELFTLIY